MANVFTLLHPNNIKGENKSGCNKRDMNQKTLYLSRDCIEITHDYEYFGIGFYSHGHLSHQVKGEGLQV